MTTITLSNSVIRSLNVIANPACQKAVREEHINYVRKELWGIYQNPKFFDLYQESEVDITLFKDGLHERTWDVQLPIENVEVIYKFYNEFHGGQWCFHHRSIIVKTGRGILVL